MGRSILLLVSIVLLASENSMAQQLTRVFATAVGNNVGGNRGTGTVRSVARKRETDNSTFRSLSVTSTARKSRVRGLGEDTKPGEQTDLVGDVALTATTAIPPSPKAAAAAAALPQAPFDEVGDCILLFGAFCNGNMGDVIQATAMENLLSSVAPKQCFWYAHPWTEESVRGRGRGEFFGRDSNRVIHLTTNHAEQVNRFKALVIGGGGVFVAPHTPLTNTKFAEALKLPIIVMGVGASADAKTSAALLQKAVFVSGRDATSVKALSGVLANTHGTPPLLRPDDVALVRDPVLSDRTLTDTDGTCWRQSEGDQQPLCFILPASNTVSTMAMHEQLLTTVRPGDVFINVFPKHQKDIERHAYPENITEMLDPVEFREELCSCRAIVSTRLHGAILGLHMGVPTFGAFRTTIGNKVPELMLNVMQLPEQFFTIDEHLTRESVDLQVEYVRHLYTVGGRRESIHARLSEYHEEFKDNAKRALIDVLGGESTKMTTEAPMLANASVTHPREVRDPDYPATTALIVVIVALAMLASRSDSRRRPFCDVFFANRRKARKEGTTRAQKNISTAFYDGSNSELGSSSEQRSPVLRDRHVPPGVAATSSKRMFVFNFSVWVCLAMGFNGYGKSYLRDTRDPVGLLVLQGTTGVAVLCALGVFGVIDLSRVKGFTSAAARQAWLPAILHTSQALLTSSAMLVGGVALTNAVKAMEPVAAAVFTYIFIGKKSSGFQLAALFTIIGGIVLLTSKGRSGQGETGGDMTVMSSAVIALAAVCCNALRNVVIKKRSPVSSHQTLLECSVAAAVVGVALLSFRAAFSATSSQFPPVPDELQHGNDRFGLFRANGLNAALCFVGYNFASFNLLAHLSPVGHAVGNSFKRMVVFANGLLVLGEVMSARQLLGAVIALVGVLAYNIAGAW